MNNWFRYISGSIIVLLVSGLVAVGAAQKTTKELDRRVTVLEVKLDKWLPQIAADVGEITGWINAQKGNK